MQMTKGIEPAIARDAKRRLRLAATVEAADQLYIRNREAFEALVLHDLSEATAYQAIRAAVTSDHGPGDTNAIVQHATLSFLTTRRPIIWPSYQPRRGHLAQLSALNNEPWNVGFVMPGVRGPKGPVFANHGEMSVYEIAAWRRTHGGSEPNATQRMLCSKMGKVVSRYLEKLAKYGGQELENNARDLEELVRDVLAVDETDEVVEVSNRLLAALQQEAGGHEATDGDHAIIDTAVAATANEDIVSFPAGTLGSTSGTTVDLTSDDSETTLYKTTATPDSTQRLDPDPPANTASVHCTGCNKWFKNKESLRSHKRCHDPRRWRCHVAHCRNGFDGFATSPALTHHINTCHPGKPAAKAWYECPVPECHRRFSDQQEGELKTHMVRSHDRWVAKGVLVSGTSDGTNASEARPVGDDPVAPAFAQHHNIEHVEEHVPGGLEALPASAISQTLCHSEPGLWNHINAMYSKFAGADDARFEIMNQKVEQVMRETGGLGGLPLFSGIS